MTIQLCETTLYPRALEEFWPWTISLYRTAVYLMRRLIALVLSCAEPGEPGIYSEKNSEGDWDTQSAKDMGYASLGYRIREGGRAREGD